MKKARARIPDNFFDDWGVTTFSARMTKEHGRCFSIELSLYTVQDVTTYSGSTHGDPFCSLLSFHDRRHLRKLLKIAMKDEKARIRRKQLNEITSNSNLELDREPKDR